MANKNRQLAQFLIASDISERFRPVLELGVVISLIMLLTALALANYQTLFVRSQLTEAFALTSTVKADIVAYRAEHGEWPATGGRLPYSTFREDKALGKVVDHLVLDAGGSLTSVFQSTGVAPKLSGKQLTTRPVLVPDSPGSPVFWSCSAYRAPEGMVASGEDKTDIDTSHLPASCREY